MDLCSQETPAARAVRVLGAKKIAAACDLTTNAVWKWERFIPSCHMPAIWRLAKAEGKADQLTAEQMIGVVG